MQRPGSLELPLWVLIQAGASESFNVPIPSVSWLFVPTAPEILKEIPALRKSHSNE